MLKFLLTICLILKLVYGFSECPNSNLSDPNISGVFNCLSWIAYLQNNGQNIQQWCQVTSNYQKCCTTCSNYQNILSNTCTDIGYVVSNCASAVQAGQCATLATVQIYCQRSCNLCPSAACPSDPTIKICNNGTCSSTTYFSQKSIICSCFNGYTGTYCNLPVNPNTCSTYGTCLNGARCLLDSLNQPFCSCPLGFYGQFCQISNPCYSFPCLNGGQCKPSSNSKNGYYCSCPAFYSGSNCQTYNPCLNNPCFNGGICLSSSVGYYCSCPNGYAGVNCQIYNLCNTNPCLNGGKCQLVSAYNGIAYTCNCLSSYYGNNCQYYNYNPCSVNNQCQNGGTCIVLGSTSFRCNCPIGYFGTFCSIVTGPCSNNPCRNGGTCRPVGTINYSCTCFNNYSGNNCQFYSYLG